MEGGKDVGREGKGWMGRLERREGTKRKERKEEGREERVEGRKEWKEKTYKFV